jgi:hypothetical protein
MDIVIFAWFIRFGVLIYFVFSLIALVLYHISVRLRVYSDMNFEYYKCCVFQVQCQASRLHIMMP